MFERNDDIGDYVLEWLYYVCVIFVQFYILCCFTNPWMCMVLAVRRGTGY